MVSIAAEPTLVARASPTRHGGWTLIAGFVTYVVLGILLMLIGSDLANDTDDMAAAAGKAVEDLTAVELSQLASDYPAIWIASEVMAMIPFTLFVLAIHDLRASLSSTRTRTLWNGVWVAALAMLAVWSCFRVISLGLLTGPDDLPPLTRNVHDLSGPMWLATALLGQLAIVGMSVALRRSAIAPRLSIVVLVFATILIVFGIVAATGIIGDASLDPESPLVPALILGIGLARVKTPQHSDDIS